MSIPAERVLSAYVERGRYRDDEVQTLVGSARTSAFRARSLSGRPWLTVSMPGSGINRVGDDAVFGVPRAAMDDQVIRKIARACPDMWLDGRWYPADVQGYHLVLATTLTVIDQDGISPDVASLLDVPADQARFVTHEHSGTPRFVRLSWRATRAS